MITGLKKISDYNALDGGVLRGDEIILLADTTSNGTVTAATISATAATNTISDSGGGLPVVKVGALVLVSGFTDTEGELNALHTVVSSDANNLVVVTDITVDEAAGQSVTVSEVSAMYSLTIAELQSLASLPDPIEDVSANRVKGVPTDVTANISGGALDFDYDEGDFQYATLSAAGVDLTVSNMPAGAQMKIVLFGAATYPPDISALTPWLNAEPPTFQAVSVIIAETLGNTTVRYINGGGYAT